MPGPVDKNLSRRERQIMAVIYRLGKATASQVFEEMEDASSDSTVRKLIRILEGKGHLRHSRRGKEFVYRPTVHRARARREAVRQLVETFFAGSAPRAVLALLDTSRDKLSPEEAGEIAEMIERTARKKRRR